MREEKVATTPETGKPQKPTRSSGRGGSKGKTYLNLEAKGKAGDYSDLIVPFDYIIIGSLPDEGSMFGGVYPEGKTAENVYKEKFAEVPGLDTNKVATRLRVMRQLGLVTSVNSLSGSHSASWQRTDTGKKEFTRWQTQK